MPKIREQIKKMNEYKLTLSPWEQGFSESIEQQYARKGRISDHQHRIADRITKKIDDLNDPALQRNRKNWSTKGYNKEKREIAQIVAKYYKQSNSPYFTDLVAKILRDADYVPSQRQYQKLCENKYSQAVVEETRRQPKFKPGQTVQMRASVASFGIANRWELSQHMNKPVIVIQVNAAPMTSHAKGAKVYKVLPMGHPKPLLCEERHLKTWKKPERLKEYE